jgi:hypothetical protein
MDNFKQPYLAKSIAEFWQKWHISLSTWFRDYVYFSMGGNKVRPLRWILNIMTIFLVSGFWHGASWTFVLWGFAHGLLYLSGALFNKLFQYQKPNSAFFIGLIKCISIAKTFFFVTLIWVLFRAQDFNQVVKVFYSLLNNGSITDNFHINNSVFIFLSLFIFLDYLLNQKRFDSWCETKSPVLRWAIYSFLIFTIIVFSSVENYPFIYFQF